jgi:DNA-binding NarL/FixJ family response regulator
MTDKQKPTFNILLADDSEDDRFILKAAIQLVPGLKVVGEVSNGTKAIAYLHGLGQFGDRRQYPMPHMLLLDLKMPFKDGFDVLEWLQEQRFKNLLIVVLTDSVHPEHVKRALDLGADYFLVKSRLNDDRLAMVRAFEEYLVKASKAPAVPKPAVKS